MEILQDISTNLQAGKADQVVELINVALEQNIDAETILNQAMIAGMTIIGQKFKAGEIFIPEVLIAARAMNRGIERLEPLMVDSGVEPKGTLVIGTVKDDLHDIGKNLVTVMFKGAGFKIIDLGVNVSSEQFLAAAKEHNPDVIGLSALLTTTMVNMEGIIQTLRDAGITSKVIIGGAPVSQEFADSVQADLYAKSAVEGVEQVLEVL